MALCLTHQRLAVTRLYSLRPREFHPWPLNSQHCWCAFSIFRCTLSQVCLRFLSLFSVLSLYSLSFLYFHQSISLKCSHCTNLLYTGRLGLQVVELGHQVLLTWLFIVLIRLHFTYLGCSVAIINSRSMLPSCKSGRDKKEEKEVRMISFLLI